MLPHAPVVQVLRRGAGIIVEAAVEPFDLAIFAGFPDQMRHGLDQRPEPFFAGAQGSLGQLAIGHVADRN